MGVTHILVEFSSSPREGHDAKLPGECPLWWRRAVATHSSVLFRVLATMGPSSKPETSSISERP